MTKEVNQLNIISSIAYHNLNIVCYIADICLLAPSATGLQKLGEYTNEKPKNYASRSMYQSVAIQLSANQLALKLICKLCCWVEILIKWPAVSIWVLLFFSDNLTCDLYTDGAANAFIKHFNDLYNTFNYLERETPAQLFRTYTSSFYGIGTWLYKMKKEKSLQNRCCLSQTCKKDVIS